MESIFARLTWLLRQTAIGCADHGVADCTFGLTLEMRRHVLLEEAEAIHDRTALMYGCWKLILHRVRGKDVP